MQNIILKPNTQRAKTAILLIYCVLVLEIISLISGYFQYDLLNTISEGYFISTETANSNDTREQIVGILYLITFIISAITFIQWFRRAYYNLHLVHNNLLFTEGWAAGSWFVPIISLFRPYQIMKEMYEKTQNVIKRKTGTAPYLSTKNLSIWWTLWIINNLIGQFQYRYSSDAVVVDDLILGTQISLLSNIIGIPLALITVKVIKDYSAIETILNNPEILKKE